MTCFWDGLLAAITNNMYKLVFNEPKTNIINFIKLLKNKNKKTTNILWNNEKISEKQMEENIIAINELNINNINTGYFCSCFEPFLFLVAELFRVDIIHNYNGYNMSYYYINRQNLNSDRPKLCFGSNTNHFWNSN